MVKNFDRRRSNHSMGVSEARAVRLGKPGDVLGESEKIGDNLYRHIDGDFIVVGPQGALRAYDTERGALLYVAYLERTERSGRRPNQSQVGFDASELHDARLTLGISVFMGAAVILLGVAIYGNKAFVETQSAGARSSTSDISSPQTALPSIAPTAARSTDATTIFLNAHPERWRDPRYVPNESDYDLIAKKQSGGDRQKEKDWKDALCAFYQNCERNQ